MTFHSAAFVLLFAIWLQGAAPPKVETAECLTAVEKNRVLKEQKVNNRIFALIPPERIP